jgi:spore coat protein U-like protein
MLFHHRARLLLGAAAFATGALLNGSSGFAATATGNMTVQASVVQTCTLGTIGTLNFGNYSHPTAANAQTNFVVNCSSAGSVDIEFSLGQNSTGAGIRRMKRGTGADAFIRYNLHNNGTGTDPWNTPKAKTVNIGPNTMTVFGTILSSEQTGTPPAGEYTDSVTITVTF